MTPTRFARRLLSGEAQTLLLYGTSLSYHLTPLLRNALVERFGERAQVVNSGLSGRASRSGLAELESRVLRHAPDTVLLEFAVNDAHSYWHEPGSPDAGIGVEESRANLETLLDRVGAALPGCEVILQTMNPAWDSPAHQEQAKSNRPHLEAYYEGYRAVAVARGLRLFDNEILWARLAVSEPERFRASIPDGVHPTPAALRGVLVPYLLWQFGFGVSEE